MTIISICDICEMEIKRTDDGQPGEVFSHGKCRYHFLKIVNETGLATEGEAIEWERLQDEKKMMLDTIKSGVF